MSLLAFYFSHSAADIISNFRVDCLFNLTQTFLKMLGGGGGECGGRGGRGGNVERNADFQCTKSLNSEDYLINSYPPLILIFFFRSSPCASWSWNSNWRLLRRKAVKRKRLGFFQYPYMVDGLLTGSSNLTQLTKVKLTDKKLTAGVVA